MSFGSTQPTRKSQTGLQLEWDCSRNKGAVSQLVNSWIAVPGGARRGSRPGPVLDENERHTVADILWTNICKLANKIELLLCIDMVYFTQVCSQLFLLFIAWEQVMLEKRRYNEKGFYIRDVET
ncbi:hypothetical protein NPX13_g10740 [Xylaria arbuscula]|uniref:Uncharacterized protein n=1 Tax=Xylaria arbuscula TaxID=114810 RepID=A0A9W8N4G9_9PEZI|nr:hypothetical protein NPX13_g10740 [Xylaria arbuscula]